MATNEFELKKGEFIFKEGDTTTDLYVIQEGIVKIFKHAADGAIVPLAVLQTGSFVGELSFFDGSPRAATAEVASERVKILKLSPEQLRGDISRFPSWLLSIIKSITERIRSANDLLVKNGIIDDTLSASFRKFEADTVGAGEESGSSKKKG